MRLDIIRVENSKDGVFGVLLINKKVFCVTLEQIDVNNAKNISCIPSGVYFCERTISPKFGETFNVVDVPNRTQILFHIGNTIKDTKGCILLGERYGTVQGQRGILNSTVAFKKFMECLTDAGCVLLNIREIF